MFADTQRDPCLCLSSETFYRFEDFSEALGAQVGIHLRTFFQIDGHRLAYILEDLSKEYDNVFTVWLPRPMVVLADHASIKEAFVTNG